MPLYSIQGPDGKTYSIEGPEGATREQVIAAIQARIAEQEAAPKPKTGFIAGLKGGFESLKGDVAALGVPLGIEGAAATQQEYKDKAAQIYRQPELTEAPWEYVKGLAGQSLAYMGAPLAAAGAAKILAPGAVVAGIGAAALAAFGTSAAQFTGSNISRQLEEGVKPDDVNAMTAVGAAIPQAALDVVGLKYIPGIQRVFSQAGKEISREEAAHIIRNGIVGTAVNTARAYGPSTLRAMGTEGLTEAAQQVFERAQAGLDLTDEQARKEYFDNFIGGVILGGGVSIPGQAIERSAARAKFAKEDQLAAQQAAADKAAADKAAADQAAADAAAADKGFKPTPVLPETYAEAVQEVEGLKRVVQTEEVKARIAELEQYKKRLLTDEIEGMRRQPGVEPSSLEDQIRNQTAMQGEFRETMDLPTREITPEAEVEAAPIEKEFPTVLDASVLDATGLPKQSGFYKQLLGKDLTNFEDLDAVLQLEERVAANKSISPDTKAALSAISTNAFNLYHRTQGELFGPRGGVLEPVKEPKAPKVSPTQKKIAEVTEGKDLSDPVQVEQVREEITDFANGKTRTQADIDEASAFLDSLPSTTPEATDVIQPTEPVGAAVEPSPVVAEQRGEVPAGGVETSEPDGMVVPAAVTGEPDVGAGVQPAALEDKPADVVDITQAPAIDEQTGAGVTPEATPAIQTAPTPAVAEGRLSRKDALNRLVEAGYSRQEAAEHVNNVQDADGTVAVGDVDSIVGGSAQKTVIDPTVIAPAVEKLTAEEQARLADHYDAEVNSPDFLARVRLDIYAFAVRGKQAIARGIRDIIKKLHAGVLAAMVIVNPNYMSAPIPVAIPKTTVTYEVVQATVPAEVRASLSPAAQEAYATIFPAIQAELKAKNKLFVLTDKPNARVVIFTPDGKPVLDKKVLLGKTTGDFYKGNTDVVSNRVTPAGLFTLGLRDAAKGGGEAKTAGAYDFGKVFVLDKAIDGEYSVTLFHSVWTKEKDAQQRLAALKKEGAEDSRYSFGCINVDKESYKFLLDNYGQQMNGAKMFVVPESPGAVMDFINGKAVAAGDLKRDIVQPVVEKVTKTVPGEPAPMKPADEEGVLSERRAGSPMKGARRRGKGKEDTAPDETTPTAAPKPAAAPASAAPVYTNLTPEGEKAAALNERMKGISNQQPDGVNTVAKGFLGLNRFFNRGENDPSLRTFLRKEFADKDASANEKIHAAFDNKVMDYVSGEIRADLLVNQAQDHANFASLLLEKGGIRIGKDGLAEIYDSPDNIQNIFNIVTNKLGAKLGSADLAMQVAHNAGIAKRASEINKRNASLEQQAQTAEAKKNFKAAKALREAMVTVRASQAEIDAGLEALKAYPEINEALDMFTRFNNNLIDFLVAAGRIDEATAENWKANTGYVPWTRVEEEVNAFEEAPIRGKVGLLNVGKLPILDRQGSSKEIANIFDNMIGHTSWVVRTALTARAANKMAEDLPDAKEIKSDAELQQALKKNRSRVIFTYKNGERTPYLLGSAADMSAFMIAPDVIPGIAKPFKAFADILRNFVTHMPAFALGQLIQDGTYRGMMLSGVEKPFSIPPKVFGNFYKILTGEQGIAAELARLGVSGVYDGMPDQVIARAREKFGLIEKGKFQKAWGKLEQFSLAADLAVRAAIYEQTLEETKSPSMPEGDRALAIYRAKEYINFKRAGSNQIIRGLRHVVPFMNAYIQGMDVLLRTMQGKGISTADKRVAMQLFWGTGVKLMALNVLYTMMVGDDDDYKGLDEYERAKNYIIPGTGVKIPVAPELGFMFKVVPEMMTNYIVSQGTERPDDAANVFRAMRDAFVNAYGGVNLTPQLVKPALEVAVNYSFFTGNPIVGQAMKNVDPGKQFTSGTSELAQLVGGIANISPMKLDYLIRGYTGMLGAFALEATDAIINPDRVAKPINKLPQISTFMYDPTGRGYKSEYYRFREEVDRVVDTVNLFKREGRVDELREYLTEERLRIYAMRGITNKIEDTLGKLRKYRNIVAADKNLSGEEKLEIIQEVQAREKAILLAYNVPKLRQAMGEE